MHLTSVSVICRSQSLCYLRPIALFPSHCHFVLAVQRNAERRQLGRNEFDCFPCPGKVNLSRFSLSLTALVTIFLLLRFHLCQRYNLWLDVLNAKQGLMSATLLAFSVVSCWLLLTARQMANKWRDLVRSCSMTLEALHRRLQRHVLKEALAALPVDQSMGQQYR